jgi:hypothetical protein
MSKNTKVVLIVVGVLVALALVVPMLMGAVGLYAWKRAASVAGVTVTGGAKDANTYTIKGKDGGEYTVGAGAKLASDFPSDIPVYAGTVLTSGRAMDKGVTVYSAAISSTDSFDTVVTYYKTALTAQGWKIVADSTVSGAHMYAGEKDDRVLSVMVMSDGGKDGKTNIVISQGKK